MNNETTETVESVAKINAEMALDQRHEYDSLEDALNSYYENVRDTLIEQGRSSALDACFVIFRQFVRVEACRLGISLTDTSYAGK